MENVIAQESSKCNYKYIGHVVSYLQNDFGVEQILIISISFPFVKKKLGCVMEKLIPMDATNENVKISTKYILKHLAFLVLSKLPIKSVKRFGCYKKSWNNLFENPSFMSMYVTISQVTMMIYHSSLFTLYHNM